MSFDISLLTPDVRPRVRHLPTTTSTMDVAAAWARDGAPHMAVVLADEMTAGRGRQGKVWQTFPGHSFAATFVVRKHAGPHLPLLAGLATVRALRQVMGKELALSLKWPNDVLLDGHKLAGILVEGMGDVYLLGIGLNLTRSPAMMESFPGVTLADYVTPPLREELLNGLSSCICAMLTLYQTSGWPALAGEYVQECCTIGKPVRWRKDDGSELVGLARGLTADGALELMDEAGGLHQVHSGDVIAQGRRHESQFSGT